jgi:disulfide bond formation protein DsbB
MTIKGILIGAAAAVVSSGAVLMAAPAAQALPWQCYQNMGPAVAADCARLAQRGPDGNKPTDDSAAAICQITGACAAPRR